MYLHACYRVGACSQELDHYGTPVLFVVYFVLKMFKNIEFYIKTSCTMRTCIFFPRARMWSSDSACMTKSSFVTEKNYVKCTWEWLKLLLITMLITGHNN